MLTSEIRDYSNKSVLCWLATSSKAGQPNVSPKEIFKVYDETTIIVANIASPKTAENINENNKICISFIDVLVQKGYQIYGTAEVIEKDNSQFQTFEKELLKMTGGKFPFPSIFKITVKTSKPIIAPKYLLYPETTEEEQVESAKKTYNI